MSWCPFWGAACQQDGVSMVVSGQSQWGRHGDARIRITGAAPMSSNLSGLVVTGVSTPGTNTGLHALRLPRTRPVPRSCMAVRQEGADAAERLRGKMVGWING